MIILDKDSEAIDELHPNDDPPPSYSAPSTSRSVTHACLLPHNVVQQNLPMPTITNYVSLAKGDYPIKRRYAIDPYISVPLSLLAPLEDGETEVDRKNLKLNTTDGNINADIWVLGGGREGADLKEKRATLDLSSNDGSITVRMHSLAEMPKSPPFHLSALARDGSIQIHVPRSFEGPITITVRDGSVQFSDELSPLVATLSEVNKERNKIRRCFVGMLPQSDEAWVGDEVEVFTRDGSVKILYEDETRIKGFFRRMFGFKRAE